MITIKTQIRQGEGITEIILKEEVGIEHAVELKTAFINGIEKSDEIQLDLEKKTNLHLSLIQIILAAKKEIDMLNKKLVIHDKNDVLDKSFSELGISGINDFLQKVEK